ncbi:MAG: exopolyphosphatase [Rhodospirillaceae bacterium]|jgi:nanoRNase/pAp phosphatase (c-di-AMP/oligoRNAs hydrolase)|nr:exopolyphosphatase [Rhodospirillaceae bacterium]MBT5244591.1 exopolyphosphatase [Rhodospirillaceae bacterium]MBT5563501.1 exopolyphosphatase [Rhodospirillaceae bacterium]MBT6240768.1 exopolyphosphatase [Rhodospirillaceae bacterium]MBT7137774.1 exopolyphosphatase [Rhodospirillaceae bacterium]
MSDKKYRLITRADFDGVVSGGLLIELEMIDDILFVEPKDMQDGKIAVTENDITTNLPYVEGVYLCFDHHLSETIRVGEKENLIIDPDKPSAARVVYEHFGGQEKFPGISTELMDAVDKADSADYTEEDILAPGPWTLLNFMLDPRTGLSKFAEFSISNEQLMKDMMQYCRHHPIEEILKIPDVEERLHIYEYNEEFAELQIRRCASVYSKLVVVDLRKEEILFPGNRFTVYAAFPACNISIQVLPHADDQSLTVLATGKSILNRSSKTNVGALMLEYGGGGHNAAGTCRVPNEDVERVLGELVERIKADG